MKPFIIFLFALSFASCQYINDYNKPKLELSGSQPYKLYITGFSWTYGMAGINQFGGDFEKLDRKVFDALQGKEGKCMVYLSNEQKDQYGHINDNTAYYGEINLTELNRYQDWLYWHNNAGVRQLIYRHTVAANSDSTVTTYEPVTTPAVPPVTQQSLSSYPAESRNKTAPTPMVYQFTYFDLYPSESDRVSLSDYRFDINGVIQDVNFENGVMTVVSQGEPLTIQYYPMNASSATYNQLRMALRPGNRIRSVCARAGAATLDLINAKITVNYEVTAAVDTVKPM